MDNITITMDEYKELLMIRGKYEELKSQSINKFIDYKPREYSLENPLKITC